MSSHGGRNAQSSACSWEPMRLVNQPPPGSGGGGDGGGWNKYVSWPQFMELVREVRGYQTETRQAMADQNEKVLRELRQQHTVLANIQSCVAVQDEQLEAHRQRLVKIEAVQEHCPGTGLPREIGEMKKTIKETDRRTDGLETLVATLNTKIGLYAAVGSLLGGGLVSAIVGTVVYYMTKGAA